MNDFNAGYGFGLNASDPKGDALSLSIFSTEWKIGYVMGSAKGAAARGAYPDNNPIIAGELAALFFLSPDLFRDHISSKDWRHFMESNQAEVQKMADKIDENHPTQEA